MACPFNAGERGVELQRKIDKLKADLDVINHWIDNDRLTRNCVSRVFLRKVLDYWEGVRDGLEVAPPLSFLSDNIERLQGSIAKDEEELNACKLVNAEAYKLAPDQSAPSPFDAAIVISEVAIETLEERIALLRERLQDLVEMQRGQPQ